MAECARSLVDENKLLRVRLSAVSPSSKPCKDDRLQAVDVPASPRDGVDDAWPKWCSTAQSHESMGPQPLLGVQPPSRFERGASPGRDMARTKSEAARKEFLKPKNAVSRIAKLRKWFVLGASGGHRRRRLVVVDAVMVVVLVVAVVVASGTAASFKPQAVSCGV